MSMLRSLDRRDALDDVVHIHSARTAGRRDLRRAAARARRRATTATGLHLQHHRRAGPRSRPADLDELCPDWRERDAFVSGPGEMLDALVEHWERGGRPRAAAHGALPAGDRRRARRRRGRHDPLRSRAASRPSATAARRSSSPARRPAPSCPSAAGWGSATPASAGSARARSGTCAPARSTARRARWSAPASTPPKATSRSHSETRGMKAR